MKAQLKIRSVAVILTAAVTALTGCGPGSGDCEDGGRRCNREGEVEICAGGRWERLGACAGDATCQAGICAPERHCVAPAQREQGVVHIDFDAYRGSEDTLPAGTFVSGENGDGARVGEGFDPFTGVAKSGDDPPEAFQGFAAYTSGDGGHAFGIRERADVDLRNARLFFAFENTTDHPVIGFAVRYDVEVWLWGERANRIRLKYDAQADWGFEDDLVSTDNPRGSAPAGSVGAVLDGTDPRNRVVVATQFFIDEVSSNGEPLGLWPLGPGDIGFLRWQFSNAVGDVGEMRSALAVSDVRIVPILGCPDRYEVPDPESGPPKGRAPGGEETQEDPALAFSLAAGHQPDLPVLEITSDLDDAIIYFTTDGSFPDPENVMTDEAWAAAPVAQRARTFVYAEPIDLSALAEAENDVSGIPTNQEAGESWAWEPPRGPVGRVVVIRARAVSDEASTDVMTRTFLPFDDARYGLPIVSLSTDRASLFDPDIGIYVRGSHPDTPNYDRRGRPWEREAHLELFEEDGARVLAQSVGIRIHGGFTRRFPRKSFRLYARSDYGTSRFRHRLFETKPIEDFNRFILRNSGNDWHATLLRDAAIHALVHHLPFDTQHHRPVVVFVNGEYWGVHNVRDRFDQHYLETHYDVSRDEVAIVELSGEVHTGEAGDEAPYLALLDAIDDGDLSGMPAVDAHMDVSGYADYLVTQMYAANTDWPHNNIRWWRYTGEALAGAAGPRDGRWRWLLFDLDHGFGLVSDEHRDMVAWTLEHQDGRTWPRRLVRALVAMPDFRHTLIQRIAVHLETTFHPDRVRAVLERVAAPFESEITEHADRWTRPGSADEWRYQVGILHRFAERRPDLFRGHVVSHFPEVTGTAALVLTNVTERAAPKVAGVTISADTPGARVDGGRWTGTVFSGVPVVIRAEGLDLRRVTISGAAPRTLDATEDAVILVLEAGDRVEVALPGPADS